MFYCVLETKINTKIEKYKKHKIKNLASQYKNLNMTRPPISQSHTRNYICMSQNTINTLSSVTNIEKPFRRAVGITPVGPRPPISLSHTRNYIIIIIILKDTQCVLLCFKINTKI